MSETAIVAIVVAAISGAAPTLLAWAALRQVKVNTSVTIATGEKADRLITKTANIEVKTEKIETATDGNLTKLTNALEVSHAENANLQAVVTALLEDRKGK